MEAFSDVGGDIIYPDMSGVVSVEEAENCGRELGRGKGIVDFLPAMQPYRELRSRSM